MRWPVLQLERRLGQIGRRERVLEQRLDAGHEDAAARRGAPGGERRDARRTLVADELRTLVGQRRPRLEGHDRGRAAQPGGELLGHAIGDLGVAGDPHQPLAAGHDEGRGEERLGAVRHLARR